MILRERFVRYFKGDKGLRPPFLHVFGPMQETLKLWLAEGMEDEYQWFREVGFEGEANKQFGNWVPVNAFVCPPFEREVLAEDGRYRIFRNSWGTTVKAPCDGSVMDYPIEFPVHDERSWKAMQERLTVDSGPRFPSGWETLKARYDAAAVPTFVGGLPCGFFGAPRELFGVERWLTSFHDSPALVEEVLDTLCDLWCELFSQVAREMRVEFFFLWEDMCYRGGPLISPAHFRQFMLPRYQRLTSTLREAGIPLLLVDTDGDATPLLPLFIEGGIDIVFPVEIQSGMDPLALRETYPTVGLYGAVEKSIPAASEQAQQAELNKIAALVRSGRFLPCSDHGVPPNVSYREYVGFWRRVREVMERA